MKNFILVMTLMINLLLQPLLSTLHAEQAMSGNSIERKKALRKLTIKPGPYRGAEAEAPLWMTELLENALADPNPTVVAEAVDQIGNLKIRSLSSRLITLYNESDSKFRGYSERVQNSIIETIGKNKGAECSEFLSDLLEDDNGTPSGFTILRAIKNLNDAGLTAVLQDYAIRMETISLKLQEKGVDALIYSNFERHGALAREIADSLGGANE